MTQFRQLAHGFMNTISFRSNPRPDPEPLYREREMTGILGGLSDEQLRDMMSYDGPISVGHVDCLKTN